YLTKTSQTACTQVSEAIDETYAEAVTSQIQTEYAVTNRHKIKLSVGESARVLLRRHARVVLVQNLQDEEITLLIALANSKQVPVIEVDQTVLKNYRAAAIIHE
ncbi:MAG: RNA-binding protein, partial [Culicoidibacterales bacterium]